MPTLHWTAYYNYINPLCLPLANTTENIEKNKNILYRLTTSLTTRQFTYVGYKKLLKTFTAPRANNFSKENYDHNIIRPNQDQFLDEDRSYTLLSLHSIISSVIQIHRNTYQYYNTSTIIHNNILKSTNSYTLFSLHSIISSVIHIHRNTY